MEKKLPMGSPRARSSCARPWRWAKTLFFLATMLVSLLLVCAPPLFVVLLDLLLPPALLSASSPSGSSFSQYLKQLRSFDVRSSLIDVPVISTARSLVILCAFLVCDYCRRLYLGITTLCSSASVVYVLLKVFGMCSAALSSAGERRRVVAAAGKDAAAVEALFLASLALAIAHVVVAYRTSCREQRKLLVYRIDVEAEDVV